MYHKFNNVMVKFTQEIDGTYQISASNKGTKEDVDKSTVFLSETTNMPEAKEPIEKEPITKEPIVLQIDDIPTL